MKKQFNNSVFRSAKRKITDRIIISDSQKKKGLPVKNYFLVSATLSILLTVLFWTAVYQVYTMYKDDLPSLEQLENITPNIKTKIYDRNDSLLKEFFMENRIWKPLDSISFYMVQTIIAVEDRKFYNHWGIDIPRNIIALLVDIKAGYAKQGASTITQQLSRNLFLTLDKTIPRKIKEAMLSIVIEKTYTKKEIIEFYLNQVYFGAGAYGIQAAAQKYFNKDACALGLHECAILAAMVKAPNKFRPDIPQNIPACKKRKNLILNVMLNQGIITRREYDEAVDLPVSLNMAAENIGEAPYFVENVRQYLEKKYGVRALYTEGLSVYTTLDITYQRIAEEAVKKQMKHLQPLHIINFSKEINKIKPQSWYKKIYDEEFQENFDSVYSCIDTNLIKKIPDSLRYIKLQPSLVCLDNQTGSILAMVGGQDFTKSKFNRSTQAWRQPGSAFKPFVYATAIDNGETPVSIFYDQPIALETSEGLWRPDNYTRVFDGPMTLRRALMLSKNLVTIQLQAHIGGARQIIKYASKMGIDRDHLHPVPSLGIGSCEVTPLAITSAYSTFPCMGLRAEPFYINRIADRNGVILEEHTPLINESLSPKTAYIMCTMLRSVVHSGTGYKIMSEYNWNRNRDVGGKTGTTNDYSDAWFIGFTKQLTTSVWVGTDTRFSIGEGRSGAIAALPVWANFMVTIHDSLEPRLPEESFVRPEGIITATICKQSHQSVNSTCPDHYEEVFISGTEPDTCNINHQSDKILDLDHNIFRGRNPKNFTKQINQKNDTTEKVIKKPLRF
ncbi:MAG: PBP1A family penicillin-binding protein [bacterium]